ncbi:MAG: hypothetical protein AAF909_10485 [Pseudomonadota bacterium]
MLVAGLALAAPNAFAAPPGMACQAGVRACLSATPAECLGPGVDAEGCAAPAQTARACLTAAAAACDPGSESEPFAARRAFSGVDSDGRAVLYCLGPDGVVDYETPSGRWRTGVWMRADGWVIMSMNDGYAVHAAELEQDALRGAAWNQTGLRWHYRLEELTEVPAGSESAATCLGGAHLS